MKKLFIFFFTLLYSLAFARDAIHQNTARQSAWSANKGVDETGNSTDFNTVYNKFYYYWRGLLYFNLNKPDAVIQDLSIFIEKNKTIAWAFYNRGAAYATLKMFKKAETDYTKAIELEKSHYFYFQRGITRFYYLNDKQNGIEDLKTALKFGSPEAQSYLNRVTR